MDLKEARIVFMGTPDFAVPSLRILKKNGANIVGVITAPDRRGGRGMKQLLTSPVKKFAVENKLTILQPTNLKSLNFIDQLRSLRADLQMVVAFRMLPEVVWSMPSLGTINLHASLLPAYRGAAPINWAIINGETSTGLTTFFIEKQIDTGNILGTKEIAIAPHDTAGSLHDAMMELGAELVLETVSSVIAGRSQPIKQDDSLATRAPKIFRETCEIDFQDTIDHVYNFIRGLSPYPSAWTLLDGKTLKITRVRIKDLNDIPSPGRIRTDNKTYFQISALNGWVDILELQLEGRKRMSTETFLNGYDLDSAEITMSKTPPSSVTPR